MKKSNGWLVGLLIALLVVLIGETGYLIKLHLDPSGAPHSSAEPAAFPYRVQGSAPAQQGRPMGVFGSSTDPFGSFGTQGMLDEEWDPFREMEDMRKTMNRLFRDSYSRGIRSSGSSQAMMTYNPDLDVRETDKEYLLKLDLPGIDKDKVNVKIENNQIVVSGERQTEKQQDDQQGSFYRAERSFGSFMRAFPLPADADADKMTAETKDGVLTVHIPKIEGKSRMTKAVEVR